MKRLLAVVSVAAAGTVGYVARVVLTDDTARYDRRLIEVSGVPVAVNPYTDQLIDRGRFVRDAVEAVTVRPTPWTERQRRVYRLTRLAAPLRRGPLLRLIPEAMEHPSSCVVQHIHVEGSASAGVRVP